MLGGSAANGRKRVTDGRYCSDTSASCLVVTAVCLASMCRQIGSRYISYSCAYQDVRRVVLFRGIARETDSCCKRVGAPLDPFIFGISVSDHRRKSETCG